MKNITREIEDTSRKVEREIARTKPSPYRSRRRTKVVVIDNYGELKSGAHFRILTYLFLVTSLVFGLWATQLYRHNHYQALIFDELTQKVAILEKRTKNLTEEKDIYMTRLVIYGQKKQMQAVADMSNVKQAAKAKEI